MRRLGARAVRRFPPVARRERTINALETETRRLEGKVRWNEAERLRLEDRVGRALRRVETFRERSEGLERQRIELLDQHHQETEELSRSIRRLEKDLQRSRGRLDSPSFLALLTAYRELYEQRFTSLSPGRVSMWQLPYKLRNYSLAQSHGVDVPEVFQVWHRPEEIHLRSIASDRFVLKSDGGHSGHGVFILQREGKGWRTLDGAFHFPGDQPPQEILDRLETWHGPYFAEEFLESVSASVVPEDIKVYTAYGQVLQILLMQAGPEGSMDRRTFTRRYIGAQGEDLGKVAEMGTHDPGIPVPESLEEVVGTAEHLSRAVGTPFIRVDLYQSPRGLVLGELTPTPGGRQRYRGEHDAFMGAEWIKAQVRLEEDLAAGRPYGPLYGRRKYPWWYGELSPSAEQEHVSAWKRTHRPCSNWCY